MVLPSDARVQERSHHQLPGDMQACGAAHIASGQSVPVVRPSRQLAAFNKRREPGMDLPHCFHQRWHHVWSKVISAKQSCTDLQWWAQPVLVTAHHLSWSLAVRVMLGASPTFPACLPNVFPGAPWTTRATHLSHFLPAGNVRGPVSTAGILADSARVEQDSWSAHTSCDHIDLKRPGNGLRGVPGLAPTRRATCA
jgi:hypothetical protein